MESIINRVYVSLSNWGQLRGKICSYIQLLVFHFFLTLFSISLNADVIFLIYLYQRWVYPVDRKRVNEFGFGGEEEDGTTAITAGDASKDTDVSADKVDEKKTN